MADPFEVGALVAVAAVGASCTWAMCSTVGRRMASSSPGAALVVGFLSIPTLWLIPGVMLSGVESIAAGDAPAAIMLGCAICSATTLAGSVPATLLTLGNGSVSAPNTGSTEKVTDE